MKKLLVTLAAVLVSVSAFAQGTVNFNNRGLTGPGGTTYHAGITSPSGSMVGATAQLYLVTGTGASATYTPLLPTASFRTDANNQFFAEGKLVTIPGQAPGTSGLTVAVRAWKGGTSFETATQERGESNIITLGALGGIPPGGGLPITPPNLDGLQPFTLTVIPEPSTMALGLLGATALLFRRRK